MDLTWITERIAIGGGIWYDSNMTQVVREGVTHIVNMQVEFDDRNLARPYPIEVMWVPVDDDLMPKPPEIFQRGVDFALRALEDPAARLFIHCAAGIHRAPMMALAVFGAMGWRLEEARRLISERRPVVEFSEVYWRSVQQFMREYQNASNQIS
jgi:protein-tyrosine phosphatase